MTDLGIDDLSLPSSDLMTCVLSGKDERFLSVNDIPEEVSHLHRVGYVAPGCR